MPCGAPRQWVPGRPTSVSMRARSASARRAHRAPCRSPRGPGSPALGLAILSEEDGITEIDVVPSLLRALADVGELGRCRSIRHFTVGGEALAPELMRAFHEQLPGNLYNMYGPTEAAVAVTCWKCD